MSVNFALKCLGSKIKSDKVSVDGYEPDNLLQGYTGWQAKGFLAERFVKPPVTLTLHLPCPVNLCRIILDPQVGGQRSTAVEIYTAVCPRKLVRTANYPRSTIGLTDFKDRKINFCPLNDKSVVCPELEPIFVRVASIRCPEPGHVCFYNPRFCSEDHLKSQSMMDLSFPHCAKLLHHQRWAVSAVDFVAVRISGTISGGVVALGRLEVWGQPAYSCSLKLRRDIDMKFAAYLGIQDDNVNKCIDTAPQCKRKAQDGIEMELNTQGKESSKVCLAEKISHFTSQKASHTHVTEEEFHIPEEYLDPLTYEIMVTPMLLPCGQTVDLSTLDRFADSEASHGRQLSDPFTGVIFTSARRPVLNNALKNRIDRFVSQHAHRPELHNIPRVLGQKEQHSVLNNDRGYLSTSNLLCNKTCTSITSASLPKQRIQQVKCGEEDSIKQYHNQLNSESYLSLEGKTRPLTSESNIRSSGDIMLKRRKFATEKFTGTSCSAEITQVNLTKALASKEISESKNRVHVSSMEDASCANSHEEQLKISLDHSLSSVLKGLPSFTSVSISSPSHSEDQYGRCQNCNSVEKVVRSTLYLVPCQHVLCRSCLVSSTEGSAEATCPLCQGKFLRAGVTRIYTA